MTPDRTLYLYIMSSGEKFSEAGLRITGAPVLIVRFCARAAAHRARYMLLSVCSRVTASPSFGRAGEGDPDSCSAGRYQQTQQLTLSMPKASMIGQETLRGGMGRDCWLSGISSDNPSCSFHDRQTPSASLLRRGGRARQTLLQEQLRQGFGQYSLLRHVVRLI